MRIVANHARRPSCVTCLIAAWMCTLNGLAIAQPAGTPARKYAAAAELQGRGEYPLAAQAWQKFIAEHKSDERVPRARHNLGVCLYQDGKYQQALEVLEKAAADARESDLAPQTQLHLGATQFALARAGRRDMYDRAAGTLRALVSKHPQGDHLPDAFYYLGECSYAQGKREDAVAWHSRLVEQYPHHRLAADAFSTRAVAREELGDRAAAVKDYKQAAAKFAAAGAKEPRSQHAPQAWLSAGRCLVLASQDAEAREPLGKALEAGGATAAEAAHWLAQALIRQKQPQEALAVLARIAPGAGDTPWAARLLVDQADAIYATAQRRRESVALYADVAARHPKDPAAPQALYRAGLAALEVGEFPTALGHAARFQAAYADHALVPDALCVAAESSLQMGKFAEAEALFQQLLKKYPNHPDGDLWKVRRAATLHAQKKYEETIRVLEPLAADLRTAQSRAEAQYLIGTSQLELKQPSAAVKSLSASLEAQPTWRRAFDAWLALGEARRQSGDLAGAQAAVGRAIADFPQSRLLDRASFRLGTYLALAGQTDAAAEAYRKVVAGWPDSPVAPLALHELGCAQLTLKDPAAAEGTFDKLLAKHVQPVLARKARYGRAMARQQQGKPAEAAADLEAVLAAWPDAKEKSDARFLLGICQAELKQYEKAAAAFRALLSEDPKYAAREEALHQWAWALKRCGREAEALDAFAKLAAEYPKSPLAPEAQLQVAEARFRGKDYAAAAVAYYAVVQQAAGRPPAERAAAQLAWCYYRQDNFADARKTFAYYLAKYPGGPRAAEAAFMEAECLFKQGLAAEALAAYARLKPSSDRRTQAAMLLHAGQAAGQLAQWSESVEWLEKLVRELPDSPALPEALCELGVARQKLGQPAEAIAALRQALEKTDREPAARAQFLIGKIQLDQNDPKEALKSFLRASYGYSCPKWQAEAAYEAARCLETLDRKPEAVSMYQELIGRFPASDRVAAAKKRLAELQGKE